MSTNNNIPLPNIKKEATLQGGFSKALNIEEHTIPEAEKQPARKDLSDIDNIGVFPDSPEMVIEMPTADEGEKFGKTSGEVIQTLSGGEITQVNKKPRKITPRSYFSEYIKNYKYVRIKKLYVELQDLSNFRLEYSTDQNPEAEATDFLRRLYNPEDLLSFRSQLDVKNHECVKSCDEWIKTIHENGVQFPFICINPVQRAGTGNGEDSFSPAANIVKRKYLLIENSKPSLHDQAALWLIMIKNGFPFRALILSGDKSIHAIFEAGPEELPAFKTMLQKLGFDPLAIDSEGTARLPGHKREDNGKYQSIIFLKGAK